jgi:glycosyltransferase involved in cell wall biosynthesis
LRVLLLTRYGRLGASSRLRAYQYLPYLQSHGFHVTQAPLLGDYYQEDLNRGHPRRWGRITAAYILRLLWLARSLAFDLVWIEYELFPWFPAFAEQLLASARIPFVVDYDDAVYHRYALHPNALVRALLGKKIDVVMRHASTVTVGNDYLAERARAVGAQCVEYLPTVVDLERYPPARRPQRTSVFTVGWVGSPSTVKYLSLIAPALATFSRKGHARLVVVGAQEAGLDGVPVEYRPWSEATEVQDILDFDVGIMPLPDDPWERGKCGYKLIQYMACSRPVIASPVGVNRQIVDAGLNGFLATTLEDWRSALDTLRRAPALGRQLGLAGRQKVEIMYNTGVTAPRLASILDRAASRDVAR